MHRGPITAQPLRYVRDAAARPERRLDEHPLIQTQPRCHTGHLHRSAACVGNGHHDRSLATTNGVRRRSTTTSSPARFLTGLPACAGSRISISTAMTSQGRFPPYWAICPTWRSCTCTTIRCGCPPRTIGRILGLAWRYGSHRRAGAGADERARDGSSWARSSRRYQPLTWTNWSNGLRRPGLKSVPMVCATGSSATCWTSS